LGTHTHGDTRDDVHATLARARALSISSLSLLSLPLLPPSLLPYPVRTRRACSNK
jgi:hypothetical protein